MKKKIHLKPKLFSLKFLAVVLIVGFLMVSQAVLIANPVFAGTPPKSFATLVAKVKNSVVNISTTQIIKESPMLPFFMPNGPFGRFQGPMPERKMKVHALGSGFVINKDGLILTNNHVVAKASSIKIKLANGKVYDAKVVGRDPKTDLALIKVKPGKDFPKPVKLGDSDAIQVGDWVVAVGNPFGLGHTVTAGIISAKGRVIGAGPYDDFLQTDAAINPGNSGGPLFNMKGEVVGINTAIIKGGQGIGFAIPINLAKKLLPQLEKGKVFRGWLGVQIQDVTPELAERLGLAPSQKGVVITEVRADSPAANAGLRPGDVILEIDRKKIMGIEDYKAALQNAKSESGLLVLIKRGRGNLYVYVVLKKKTN